MKSSIVYGIAHLSAELASFVVGYGIYYVLVQMLFVAGPIAFAIAAVVTLALWFASFFFIGFSSNK